MRTEITSPRPIEGAEKPLSLNERLGLIGLIEEGLRLGSSSSPLVADLFSNLWELMRATVSGSKIDRLKPEDSQNGFRLFEVNAETGENLGRLNMLYLKKPIPCYYLVYVEVAAPYRKKGLGNRILEHFRNFLSEKSAIGILDNIIPKDDPTYDIYNKHAWDPIEEVIGPNIPERCENYMIYVPPRLRNRDLKQPVLRLLHHLVRKRAAIDMRDNEVMVQRTIAEFKELYAALLTYFGPELEKGESHPFMRFMFTRFVTKLIAFRRRIGELLGYTGGESLEQLVLAEKVAALPAQSYVPRELATEPSSVVGDESLWDRLPEALRKRPAPFIEALPNYRRPSFVSWLQERGVTPRDPLTIGNLMDLGFDPTRLKEITLDGRDFIFERIQIRQLPDLKRKKDLLEQMKTKMGAIRPMGAQLSTNPPLLVIQDRGNAYVLRRKVDGIHWDEAVEQLQSAPSLSPLNATMNFDRIIFKTVRAVKEATVAYLEPGEETLLDLLTYFVSWDLRTNRPKVVIDPEGTFLKGVWLA